MSQHSQQGVIEESERAAFSRRNGRLAIRKARRIDNRIAASGMPQLRLVETIASHKAPHEAPSEVALADAPAAKQGVRQEPAPSDSGASVNTDDMLVQRAQAGDQRAFGLLVSRHQQALAALISQYVKDHDAVKDVTQESFIRAYKALQRFRNDSKFYTWLYRIGVNAALNYLAANKRTQNQVALDATQGDDAVSQTLSTSGPDMAVHQAELATRVKQAISALPSDLKSALTLREYDGLSYAEIADVMDCPIGTVRSRIARAREYVVAQVGPLRD